MAQTQDANVAALLAAGVSLDQIVASMMKNNTQAVAPAVAPTAQPNPPQTTAKPQVISVGKGGKTLHQTGKQQVTVKLVRSPKERSETFDPVSYYSLAAVVRLTEDGGYQDGPISIGIVNHPQGATRTDKEGKEVDLTKYNGNVVIIGLKRTAEVFDASVLYTLAQLGPAIQKYLESHAG